MLAVDSLVDHGYLPAELSAARLARLDEAMPPIWSKANPVDIIGDADAARYTDALQALIEDKANDAILVLNVQTALASSARTAKAVCDVIAGERQRIVSPKADADFLDRCRRQGRVDLPRRAGAALSNRGRSGARLFASRKALPIWCSR